MSFQICCVSGCMNRGRGLHRFPNPERDPDRFKIWKLFSGVGREGMTEDRIANSRRICRSHFSEQFHYPRNKLCRLAVPTLLPGKHPTESEKTIYYSSRISETVDDPVKASDIASNSHSLDSPLPKSSNASSMHENAATRQTENLPEKVSDTQPKIRRDILIEDDPVARRLDVIEHGPPMTEDQGDISMYHDDDPLRPAAEAGTDSKDPVDKSVDGVEHGPPMTENQGDVSMYHDDDPLRPAAEAGNDSNDHVNKSVDVVEHGPPITEDQGDVSMYHDDDPLRPAAEARNDSNDHVDESVYVVEHAPPMTEDQGDISMYHDDDPLRPAAEARTDSSTTDECYFCNVCKESIKGFRYTCVQCEDWDLCGACEARAAHAAHYVLRIPSPRPYKEIQAVLTAVRQQLINKKIIPGKADSVKEEPNSEPEDAIEPDTLNWDDDFYEEDNICIELEDGEHPPRKRLRPGPSSTHRDHLTTPESPKPTRDYTTDVLFNHDVVESSKDIRPRTLPNDTPSIHIPGLIRLTGTIPHTTGTLLPTITLKSKRTLTLKPISRLPLGARVIKLSACFGNSAICKKEDGDHPPPRKLVEKPSSTHSDQDLTTPESLKPTLDRTTHVYFNHDVSNSAKDIQSGTLPNDTQTIPKPGLNWLIGTMPQTTGTLLPRRALNNSRTTHTREPISVQSLGLRVVKKTVIVGHSASRLSEEKTAMSFPSVDKSSSQRPDHITAVSSTTTITTLERAAMSDPKATSKWYLRILKGTRLADVITAPKSKVSVRLRPIDNSKME